MINKLCTFACRRLSRLPVMLFAVQNVKLQQNEIDLALYYRNLLRKTKAQDNGLCKFPIDQLLRMVNMAQTEADSEVLLEALYNFYGHQIYIDNTTVDRVVQKYLETGGKPQQILELYKYHTYLHYFPHYTTTLRLLGSISTNPDQIKLFLEALELNKFLKIDKPVILKLLQLKTNIGDVKKILKLEMERNLNVFAQEPFLIIDALSEYHNKAFQLTPAQNIYVCRIILALKPKRQQEIIKIALLLLHLRQISQSIQFINRLPKIGISCQHFFEQLHEYLLFRKIKSLDNYTPLYEQYTSLFSKKPMQPPMTLLHQSFIVQAQQFAEGDSFQKVINRRTKSN